MRTHRMVKLLQCRVSKQLSRRLGSRRTGCQGYELLSRWFKKFDEHTW